MIGSWWKKRNEILAITACSCTFGAIMLEVGIYAAHHDAPVVTTDAGSNEIPSVLSSAGSADERDTGPFAAAGSPEAEALRTELHK